MLVTSDATGLGQTVRAGRHVLRGDEPLPMGADTGPSPYDFLLAGLGTCTAMTLQLYARRKGWDLRGVEVSLRHGRRHLDDCEDCCAGAATGCRIEVVDRTVSLTGDLSAEQRTRLLEIADQCPVHRTITGDLRVRTTLA